MTRAWLVVLLTACEGAPTTVVDAPPPDAPPDAALADADPPLAVAFTTPAMDTVHTNGDVALTLEVTGGAVDAIELHDGVTLLATLDAAPYTYVWSTAAVAEGPHVLQARAIVAGVALATDQLTVVVDRTPPELVSTSPAAGAALLAGAPVRFTFSEALDPDATGALSGVADANGAGYASALGVEGDEAAVTLDAWPQIPTTVTVIVMNVADLAGNVAATVQIDLSFTWVSPAFVGTLPATTMPLDATLAPDGTLYLLYVSLSTSSTLRVARWDGTDWVAVGPALPYVVPNDLRGTLTIRDDGTPAVFLAARDVFVLEGGAWEDHPSLDATNSIFGFDVLATTGDELVLLRCDSATNMEVWRGDNLGWVLDAELPLAVGNCEGDLLENGAGYIAVYSSEESCGWGEWSAATGWVNRGLFHEGTSSLDRCRLPQIARSGDGDLYVGYQYFFPVGGGAESATAIRVLDGLVFEPSGIDPPGQFAGLGPSPASFVAVVHRFIDGVAGYGIVTATGASGIEGVTSGNHSPRRVLSVGGEPVVLFVPSAAYHTAGGFFLRYSTP